MTHSDLMSVRVPAATRLTRAVYSSCILLSTAPSGWRKSTVKKTLPGMTLREFGRTSTSPTVPMPAGGWLSATWLTPSVTRAQASMASFRVGIGVAPAWLSRPVTVTSYQRCPWAPVTTPMVTCSWSSMGPCSMCNSK